MRSVLAAVATLLTLALLPAEVLARPTRAASPKCPEPQIDHVTIYSPLFFRDPEDQDTWAGDGSDDATENAVATVYLTDALEGDNDLAGSSANHLRLKPTALHNDLAKRGGGTYLGPPSLRDIVEIAPFVVCDLPRCLGWGLVKKTHDYCGPWLGLSISIKWDEVDNWHWLIPGDLNRHPERWTARYEPVRQGVGKNVEAVIQYIKHNLRRIVFYNLRTARQVLKYYEVEFENPEDVLHNFWTTLRKGALE